MTAYFFAETIGLLLRLFQCQVNQGCLLYHQSFNLVFQRTYLCLSEFLDVSVCYRLEKSKNGAHDNAKPYH